MSIRIYTLLTFGCILSVVIGLIAKFNYSVAVGLELVIHFALVFIIFLFMWEREDSIHNKGKIGFFVLLFWCLYSTLINVNFGAFLQLIIYFSFVLLIFVNVDCSGKKLLLLVFILMVLQLPFDLLLPNVHLDDPKDMYSGTFIMANNKSRFIGFLLPFLVFYICKASRLSTKVFSMAGLASIIVSFYLGYSNISYSFILISLVAAFCIKSNYIIFWSLVLPFLFLPSIFDLLLSSLDLTSELEYLVEINTSRYFSEVHGVVAVYHYGMDILKEYLVLWGVGLGEFTTRGAQLVGSELNQNIPATMITYGTLSEASTPYGLSSFFILIVEGGIVGVFFIYLVVSYLMSLGNSFLFRYMFAYLVLMFLYSPVLLEFSEFSAMVLLLKVIENYSNSLKSRALGSKNVIRVV